MITLAAYTDTKIYTLHPQGLKLSKRFEHDLYSYVASDVQLTLFDAKELYDDVLNGTTIWIVITYKSDTQEHCLFFGYIQPESAVYEPEKDEYSITALHCSKKIMEIASSQYVLPSLYWGRVRSLSAPYSFDAVGNNNLSHLTLPLSSEYPEIDVVLEKATCENSLDDGSPVCDAYCAYLQQGYTVRQHWIDFSKHYNLLWYVADQPGRFLVTWKRRDNDPTFHRGYDPYLIDYKESFEDAYYNAVLFPALVLITVTNQTSRTTNTLVLYLYCLYRNATVTLYSFHPYSFDLYEYLLLDWPFSRLQNYLEVDARCFDLRIPADVYRNTFTNSRALPFRTVKQFPYKPMNQLAETPLQYAQRKYARYIRPRKIYEVAYSTLILAAPEDEIVINGHNARIKEIEYDLEHETTTITAEQYL